MHLNMSIWPPIFTIFLFSTLLIGVVVNEIVQFKKNKNRGFWQGAMALSAILLSLYMIRHSVDSALLVNFYDQVKAKGGQIGEINKESIQSHFPEITNGTSSCTIDNSVHSKQCIFLSLASTHDKHFVSFGIIEDKVSLRYGVWPFSDTMTFTKTNKFN